MVAVPMAFKTLSHPFIRPSPATVFSSNGPSSLSPSSLRLFLCPRRILRPLPSSAASPVFLPHLEVRNEDAEEEGEEEELIRDFSEYPSPNGDEGRLYLQRNRRSSCRIADIDSPEEEGRQTIQSDSSFEDGVLGEILRIMRTLSDNPTLGDLLDPYAGKVGEGDCVRLLRRMGEEGLVWGCLSLFEWMGLQEPSLLTPIACSVMFPILGREGMGDELMLFFQNLPPTKQFRDVRVYNAAISGFSCCGRYDDAWRVYDTLECNNIRPDHVTCSILLTVMRKSGQCARDAWQFLERMNRKGVNGSLEVFGALITFFCDEGLKKEALIIQSEMEKKGILSNAMIYNTLMDAYSRSNQVEEAEGLFGEMKEKGLTPTVATYNVLLDAYSRRMQPEIIDDLLLEMQRLGLQPNGRSYTCLISAYGRHRKMSGMAADSFLRMKVAGVKPTSQSYTALIHAYSVGGWHEKAYTTYESMVREGIAPSIETYTVLLDAFRRAGETQKLMEIWKSMIANKVEGTRVTFNILLDGLAKRGLYVQAKDVVAEFGRIGLQPNVITYNMLMNAYARGGQHYKLPQLLKEMAVLKIKPDSITYSTMIYAYVRARDFTKAFYYHKQMVKSGQMPDASSYRRLRSLLDVKTAAGNMRDKSAILGIVNSRLGLKPKKGKKDEFWKSSQRRSITMNRVIGGRGS